MTDKSNMYVNFILVFCFSNNCDSDLFFSYSHGLTFKKRIIQDQEHIQNFFPYISNKINL